MKRKAMKAQDYGRLAALVLVLLLGIGAFWDGLYTPAHQLVGTAVLGVLLCWMAGAVPLARSEAVSLGLLATGAVLSLLRPAAAGTAAHGPLIVAGWTMALIIGRRMAGNALIYSWIGRFWATCATFMVFAGLAAMSYLPAHHSGRLASFLGYPIAVGVLGMLGLAGALPDLQAGRWWAPILAFGSAAGVVLSGSRGVWAAAVLLALYLLWANPALLLRAWWSALIALAASLWIGPAVAVRYAEPALGAFLLGGLTTFLVDRFPRRAVIAVAAAALAGALLLAPGWDWFLGRATALPGTEGSSVERMVFVTDGLNLVREWPLGAGYRAWTALHLQGASYGYFSAEVHSAPLDLAIGFGWAGAAGFLLLLARYWLNLRLGRTWSAQKLVVLAGLGALAVHAMVDWDLSYGLFVIPLWLGFGLMAPDPGPTWALPRWAQVGAAGLALAGVVVVGAGDIFTQAADNALAKGDAQAALAHASMATAVTPWNDLGQAALGRAFSELGDRADALDAYGRAMRLGPYEPWFAQLRARELVLAKRWGEAAIAWRETARLWPWKVEVYEAALNAQLELAMMADMEGNTALSDQVRAEARATLGDLDRQKAREPAGMPRRAMNVETESIRRARQVLGEQ